MITLGINAAFHDSAAALVVDGALAAAAEEERFSRVKHAKRPVPFSTWELPHAAVDFCLAQAGIELRHVDHVAYSFQPETFADGRATEASTISLPLQPSASDPGPWESPWDPLFLASIVNAPRQLVDGVPHPLRKRFGGVSATDPPYRWHFVDHHQCHQASAYLVAPFERCAVMTLDGRGERATTTYGRFDGRHYEPLGDVRMPHSLGLLYERITQHLGFLHSSDEYKVMALAALGQPRLRDALAAHVHVGDRGRVPDAVARSVADVRRAAPAGRVHWSSTIWILRRRCRMCWKTPCLHWRAGCAAPATSGSWRWPAAWR